MGGKRKGGNRSNYKGNKRPRPTDANGWNDTEKLSLQDFKNSRFDAYYQAQKIVPEGQWEEFLAALRRHLPISFRLSAISGCDTRLLKELKGNCFGMAPGFEMKMTDEDGIEHVARRPEPLPFYKPFGHAWQMELSKRIIRKLPEVQQFRQFLIREDTQGNITRQETVSMIPPLLLDVQPHHIVLDMCAAPGSKTAQLLEQLHAQGPGIVPSGLVIANDADPKRAYMLVHQLKRLGSPSFLVTTHPGQSFPNLFVPKVPGVVASNDAQLSVMDEKEIGARVGSMRRLEFDRILCDVPCSGDGTLRKSPNIWKLWNAQNGTGLHPLQAMIAYRAAQLLKVGGYMVYSTCSFNPIENEAVVAQLLRRAQGSLELVDVSKDLSGLKSEPGLLHWVVDVQGGQHESEYKESEPWAKRKQIRRSLFPPQSDEAKAMHLERCVRVLPHKQDTGGFFIVLIKKVSKLPDQDAQAKTTMESSSSSDALDKDIDLDADVAADAVAMEGGGDNDDEEKKEEKAQKSSSTDATDAADVVTFSSTEAAAADSTGRKGNSIPLRQVFNDSPFSPLKSELYQTIVDTYGLSGASSHNLLGRSETGEGKKVYFLSDVASSVVASSSANWRLKVVHTGLKAFEQTHTAKGSNDLTGKSGNEKTGGVDAYRITQEGIAFVSRMMGKQVVSVSSKDILHLLPATKAVPLDGEDCSSNDEKKAEKCPLSAEFQANLRKCAMGSVALMMEPSDDEKDLFAVPITLAAWLTSKSIGLMITKPEKDSLMQMLTGEVPLPPATTADTSASSPSSSSSSSSSASM